MTYVEKLVDRLHSAALHQHACELCASYGCTPVRGDDQVVVPCGCRCHLIIGLLEDAANELDRLATEVELYRMNGASTTVNWQKVAESRAAQLRDLRAQMKVVDL